MENSLSAQSHGYGQFFGVLHLDIASNVLATIKQRRREVDRRMAETGCLSLAKQKIEFAEDVVVACEKSRHVCVFA